MIEDLHFFNQGIAQKFQEFAKLVLSDEELTGISMLSKQLLSSEPNRRQAIEILQKKIGTTPKRPLYYVYYDLRSLPNRTRAIVEYMGHYLDHMVKFVAEDILRSAKYAEISMGGNLKYLNGKISEDLHSNLTKYNELVYVPAKHNFKVIDRPHLFSSAEAVLVCFVTLALAEKLVPLSELAHSYFHGNNHNYNQGMDVDDPTEKNFIFQIRRAFWYIRYWKDS